MIGEYLGSVKTEMERVFDTEEIAPRGPGKPLDTEDKVEIWIVDDCMMPREPQDNVIRGVLEAEVGDPVSDTTRTRVVVENGRRREKKVALLETSTTLRLEKKLGDFEEDRNPHQQLMTLGANTLDWLDKDVSFAYQSDVCEAVSVSSEIDLLSMGLSIVIVRWNATVVAKWPLDGEPQADPISNVQFRYEIHGPGGATHIEERNR